MEPTAEELERWRRSQPPENEVPVALPVSVVLARTEEIALALAGARAFSTGVQVELTARTRREPAALGSVLDGVHRGGSSGGLLVGVEFADGRAATTAAPDPYDPRRLQGDRDPVLVDHGGSAGGRTADVGLWLSPLPPAGPLTVVVLWADAGIPETRTVLDGGEFARAGAAAEVLWPVEPDPAVPGLAPAPEVPPGSWFDRALRPQRD